MTIPNPPALPIRAPFEVQGLHATDDTGDTWLGHVELFGATYHVELVRVQTRGDVQDVRDAAGELAAVKFQAMQTYYDGRYELARIPGLEGRYAMFVTPYCN